MKKAILLAALAFSADAWGQSCYEASVTSPNPLMGNDGEIVKLSDGTLWEVKYEYEYLYEYYPTVIICPSRGKMGVKGKMLNVNFLGGSSSASSPSSSGTIIESKIDGEFTGWEGETVFKLMNGQVWQQIDGRYKYKYKYSPKVLLINRGGHYEMQVDGVDTTIKVVRLK
ncbi:hypothetical protein ACO0J1_05425 [Stenotrophomonas acidaminiphila]|jgi:hypothetical protein|uniref:hypothetical protein n=1 Tax=Stenotrophomonas acidaminiphila TaxID=128780 RepID=UPI003BF3CED6